MQIRITGTRHSVGEFIPEGQKNPVPYDNIIIFYEELMQREDVDGHATAYLKIKSTSFPGLFKCDRTSLKNTYWNLDNDNNGRLLSVTKLQVKE